MGTNYLSRAAFHLDRGAGSSAQRRCGSIEEKQSPKQRDQEQTRHGIQNRIDSAVIHDESPGTFLFDLARMRSIYSNT
jgi:hypothetical protein